MAFGLATEDDDAQILTKQTEKKNTYIDYNQTIDEEKAKAFKTWIDTNNINEFYLNEVLESYGYGDIKEIKNKDLKKITYQIQSMLKGE